MSAPERALTRGERRRAQIVEVATLLLTERGYHETSMESIADAVGIRKASLYYYFESKDQLLVQIHRDMIDYVIDLHQVRIDGGGLTPSELLRGMITDLIQLLEIYPGRRRIFFEHFRELPVDMKQDVAAKRDLYGSMLVDVLEKGKAEGQFSFDDAALSAMFILGACNWAYQWFRPTGAKSAKEVADYFYRQVLTGLTASERPSQ
jgi:AcrR family transcriptional regulator